MIDPAARLETMREMFLYAQNLYSWTLDADFGLRQSNCPSERFFFDLFRVSYCAGALEAHLKHSDLPCIVNDSMGFVWIAAAGRDAEGGRLIYLLGPIFTMEASENYLRQACRRMKLSDKLTEEMLNQISLVTVLPSAAAVRYAVMLHYCVTGERVGTKDVTFYAEAAASAESVQTSSWGDTNWHGTWEMEQKMWRQIREGVPVSIEEMSEPFAGGRVGRMCPGDPLRQAKDEVIIFAALASRAAIEGGVSPEGGYNLADYYIQRTEAAKDTADVYHCGQEMFSALQDRVRRCRENTKYSPPVAACIDYIETHICEKISLDEMASAAGYTSYYLSSKFQKEMGVSVSAYIKKRKIEIAKEYLDMRSGLTAADISERLAFSSPSYFSSVFRKETGMTPTEYMNRRQSDMLTDDAKMTDQSDL